MPQSISPSAPEHAIEYLLSRNFLLTAFELLQEASEAGLGHEVERLRLFFKDPVLFPPEEVAACNPENGAIYAQVAHERQQQLSQLQYDLALAREQLAALSLVQQQQQQQQQEQGSAGAATSAQQGRLQDGAAGGQQQQGDTHLSPAQLGTLHSAVLAHLQAHGFKLAALSLAKEAQLPPGAATSVGGGALSGFYAAAQQLDAESTARRQLAEQAEVLTRELGAAQASLAESRREAEQASAEVDFLRRKVHALEARAAQQAQQAGPPPEQQGPPQGCPLLPNGVHTSLAGLGAQQVEGQRQQDVQQQQQQQEQQQQAPVFAFASVGASAVVVEVAACMPKVLPNLLINKRDEMVPVLCALCQEHPDPAGRRQLAGLLFNLIRKPNAAQRTMIVGACVGLADRIGPARAMLDLIPHLGDQVKHDMVERRLLVAEAAGALAPHLPPGQASSVVLRLAEALLADPQSQVRCAALGTLCELTALGMDTAHFGDVLRLVLAAAADNCGDVAQQLLNRTLPAVLSWVGESELLTVQLLPQVLGELQALLDCCPPAGGAVRVLNGTALQEGEALMRSVPANVQSHAAALLQIYTAALPTVRSYALQTQPAWVARAANTAAGSVAGGPSVLSGALLDADTLRPPPQQQQQPMPPDFPNPLLPEAQGSGALINGAAVPADGSNPFLQAAQGGSSGGGGTSAGFGSISHRRHTTGETGAAAAVAPPGDPFLAAAQQGSGATSSSGAPQPPAAAAGLPAQRQLDEECHTANGSGSPGSTLPHNPFLAAAGGGSLAPVARHASAPAASGSRLGGSASSSTDWARGGSIAASAHLPGAAPEAGHAACAPGAAPQDSQHLLQQQQQQPSGVPPGRVQQSHVEEAAAFAAWVQSGSWPEPWKAVEYMAVAAVPALIRAALMVVPLADVALLTQRLVGSVRTTSLVFGEPFTAAVVVPQLQAASSIPAWASSNASGQQGGEVQAGGALQSRLASAGVLLPPTTPAQRLAGVSCGLPLLLAGVLPYAGASAVAACLQRLCTDGGSRSGDLWALQHPRALVAAVRFAAEVQLVQAQLMPVMWELVGSRQAGCRVAAALLAGAAAPALSKQQVSRQLLPLLSTLGSDPDPHVCEASIAAAAVIFRCLHAEQDIQEALLSNLDDVLIAGGHGAEVALLAVLGPAASKASTQQLDWLLQRLQLMLASIHQRTSCGKTPAQLVEAAATAFVALRQIEGHEFTDQRLYMHYAAALAALQREADLLEQPQRDVLAAMIEDHEALLQGHATSAAPPGRGAHQASATLQTLWPGTHGAALPLNATPALLAHRLSQHKQPEAAPLLGGPHSAASSGSGGGRGTLASLFAPGPLLSAEADLPVSCFLRP